MKKYIAMLGFTAVLLGACKTVDEAAVPANGTELPSLTAMTYSEEPESEPFIEAAAAETVTESEVPAVGEEKTETASETGNNAEIVSEMGNNSETVSETEISAESAAEIIPVENISLSTYSVSLTVGQRKMPIVTMFPANASDKGELWESSDTDIAAVDRLGNITGNAEGNCIISVISAQNPEVRAEVEVTVTAGVQPTYINGILVVNKTYALPADYGNGIDPEAQKAFDKMQTDAAAEGLNIYISSGYRSYDYQAGLYQRYVDRDGKAAADRYSARAGHSEHQTGLAFDLNTISDEFRDTDEGRWVAANCADYGFIIRYPDDKEDVTGYMSEPWHIRYLGVETAQEVNASGLCLEEYLGITSEYAE